MSLHHGNTIITLMDLFKMALVHSNFYWAGHCSLSWHSGLLNKLRIIFFPLRCLLSTHTTRLFGKSIEKKEEINTNLSIQWVPIFTQHHWIRTNLFFFYIFTATITFKFKLCNLSIYVMLFSCATYLVFCSSSHHCFICSLLYNFTGSHVKAGCCFVNMFWQLHNNNLLAKKSK